MSSINQTSEGLAKSLSLIDKRRKGEILSLRTSFEKLNKALLNGVDWNRIITIAGRSGSGKSTILEQIKRDFCKYNPQDSFSILSFEFEMIIEDSLARSLSALTGLSIKELYSADTPLDDAQFEVITKAAADLNYGDNIFYVDKFMTVDDIRDTILRFAADWGLLMKDMGLIVTLDHTVLTKGKTSDSEKAIVDELMLMFLDLKKHFSSQGMKFMVVLLSQLNRDIESIDRVTNPNLHYPDRSDIFAASSVYNGSDYVLISHRPATIRGMGQYYGPPKEGWPKGLPTKAPDNSGQDMVYWHLIKERFGKPTILTMVENFKESSIKEINLK